MTPQSVSSAPLPAPEPDDFDDMPEAGSATSSSPDRPAGVRTGPSVAPHVAIEPDNDGASARLRAKSNPLPLFEGLPGSLSPAGRDALRRALSDLEQCRRLLAGADASAESDQGLEGAA